MDRSINFIRGAGRTSAAMQRATGICSFCWPSAPGSGCPRVGPADTPGRNLEGFCIKMQGHHLVAIPHRDLRILSLILAFLGRLPDCVPNVQQFRDRRICHARSGKVPSASLPAPRLMSPSPRWCPTSGTGLQVVGRQGRFGFLHDPLAFTGIMSLEATDGALLPQAVPGALGRASPHGLEDALDRELAPGAPQPQSPRCRHDRIDGAPGLGSYPDLVRISLCPAEVGELLRG